MVLVRVYAVLGKKPKRLKEMSEAQRVESGALSTGSTDPNLKTSLVLRGHRVPESAYELLTVSRGRDRDYEVRPIEKVVSSQALATFPSEGR